MSSARKEDINGFVEIEGNPITRVGVFPYAGWQISEDLPRDKIFMVYRPEEELTDEECVNSFKLLPWVDDHTMLGNQEELGLTPAEKKGVEGVIGEQVYYDDNAKQLKANLKIFSRTLGELIDKGGKKELSIGYRCVYVPQKGVYNDQTYDFVQRKIRGNHLALVDEGRAGKDVAVLDGYRLTADSMELTMEPEEKLEEHEEREEMTLEKLAERLAKLESMLASKDQDLDDEKKEVEEDEALVDAPVVKEVAERVEDEDEDMKKELKEVADSVRGLKRSLLREVAQRDALVSRLSTYIGTFDHADKTLDDVVNYGLRKLNLKCAKGHEQAMLEGYLAGKQSVTYVATQDAAPARKVCSEIDSMITKGVRA